MNEGKGDQDESESEIQDKSSITSFSNRESSSPKQRSCGVVRSIMSDSRSVDPGSNPGTSTNSEDLPPQNSLKLIFVR